MKKLSHLDKSGAATMVDVGAKLKSSRRAIAAVSVKMRKDTLTLIEDGSHKKGDVLSVARIAGIQAAKRCSELIPLCHPLLLEKISVDFVIDFELPGVQVTASCSLSGKTGVEMEAMTAASIAALTIYDMCKGVDREICIDHLRLLEKHGGKTGSWVNKK
mgnify:FL=1